MELIIRIFSSRSKLLQIITLVIISAIIETLLLFNLSNFGSSSNYGINPFALLLLLAIMALFSRLGSLWLVNHRCLSSISDLNSQLLDVAHSKSVYGRVETHNFISTAEKVQIIGTSVLVPVVNGIASLFVGFFIFVALAYLYGGLVYWVAITIILFYASVILMLKKPLYKNSKILKKYQTFRALLINEASDGATELEFTGTVDKQKNRFIKNERNFVSSSTKVLFLGGMPRFILETLLIISMVTFISFQSDMNLGVNDIVTFGFGCLRLVPLAQQSYNGWARYRGNSSAIVEILASLNGFINKPNQFYSKKAKIDFSDEKITAEWDHKLSNVLMDAPLKMEFQAGHFTLLAGDSGSGKTTLVNDLIAAVHSEGLSVGLVAPYNARFSHSVSEYFDFFNQNDSENLMYLIKIFRLDEDKQYNFFDKKVTDLSTGEFQRIQIIRELLREPRLLILDEALSNLDKDLVKLAIKQIQLLECVSVLIISHSPITVSPILMKVSLKT